MSRFVISYRCLAAYSELAELVPPGAQARSDGALLSGSWGSGNSQGKLAGAEGFEPSPSSLTVRCPTGWTTPQRQWQQLLRGTGTGRLRPKIAKNKERITWGRIS